VTFGTMLMAGALGVPSAAIYMVLAVFVSVVLLEHVKARDTSSRSWLDVLFAPRIYRSSRRLILIACAIALPASDFPKMDLSVAGVATYSIVIFAFDRFLPVVPRPSDRKALGGGTSPWLRRTVILACAGLAGAFLVVLFVLSLPSLGLNERVRDVRSRRSLVYNYNNPALLAAVLAEPRADRVDVRWIGRDPPSLFRGRRGRRRAVPLTYFGSSNGTSVFFAPTGSPRGGGGMVYRWPTAAVAVESIDGGREISRAQGP
jgi:hypothetical protein